MNKNLPPGWEWARIDKVCNVVLGQSPPGSSYNQDGQGLPFFQGKAEFGDRYPVVRKWTTDPKKCAPSGSILVSVRAPVGPTNITHVNCAIGRGLAALRPVKGTSTEYIFWAMRYSVANLAERASGSTFEAITGKQLRTHRLPVAPLAEQKRIVDAIEEHFSHLDAAEATLRLTLKRLDTLRSSILADAFHTNRKLPEGWKWAKLGDLCLPIQNINPRTIPNLQFKYIDIGGIDPNLGVVRYTKSLRGSGAPSRARQLVRSGDIVLSTVRTYQKKTAIVPSELDGAIASTGFAVLRPAPSVNSWFIFYQVRATNFVDSLNMMQTGTSYPAIRDNDVRSSFVRIAPAGEQERIVAYIEQRFSHLDALAAIANVSLERISALRRSILAAAFSGRLVPQDPEDEPASILLERIAASRAAEPARRRART